MVAMQLKAEQFALEHGKPGPPIIYPCQYYWSTQAKKYGGRASPKVSETGGLLMVK